MVCDASDNCDPDPALSPVLHVLNHDVPVAGGPCVERIDDFSVACDEIVEIRLLAPPCPARSPSSPVVAHSVNSGVQVLSGERVTFELRATDRCGNSASDSFDPAANPSPLCDDQTTPGGVCCPPIGQPPAPKCRVPVCVLNFTWLRQPTS